MSEIANHRRIRDFLVLEKDDAIVYLAECAKLYCSTLIWTSGQELVLETHVSHLSPADRALYTWTPKDLNPRKLSKFMSATGEKQVLFSVTHPRATLFFKSSFEAIHTGSLRFSLPSQIYKIERRKEPRLVFDSNRIVRVQYPDPNFPKSTVIRKVLDLSTKGMAFQISQRDLSLYPRGRVIKGLKFRLQGKSIIADGEVRHSAKISQSGMIVGKVGLLFQNMNEINSDRLACFIFEENKKFFSPET